MGPQEDPAPGAGLAPNPGLTQVRPGTACCNRILYRRALLFLLHLLLSVRTPGQGFFFMAVSFAVLGLFVKQLESVPVRRDPLTAAIRVMVRVRGDPLTAAMYDAVCTLCALLGTSRVCGF